MSDGLKKALMGLAALILVVLAVRGVWDTLGDSVVADANTRTLMDSETGQLVEVRLSEDYEPYPHKNPKTGKKTLYPTEVCYANACAAEGTRVILNEQLGKEGPTYCPKCGALVRFHNPRPRTETSGDE